MKIYFFYWTRFISFDTQQVKQWDAAEKRVYSQSSQVRDVRTSLKSTFLKVKGLGYLWDKEAEWPQMWGKIIRGKRKVKQLAFHAGLSWRRQWYPTPELLPGISHDIPPMWRSLVGCSTWSPEESDTTEWLHFHFSLSCIGEGNGNLLQCSCLENPRDGGAWWAAIYGVTQGRTLLKRLSSSSSRPI